MKIILTRRKSARIRSIREKFLNELVTGLIYTIMAKLKKSPTALKQELKAKRMEKVIKKQEEKKMKKRKTNKTPH